ncbi:adenosine deaminase [Homoserinibacter sp. YIM 151385]|uniref:adenosine deaminase n=1 Tax=Homoserinibacter sp. YIM 151385 TaxID=2985506 RepID=UPI0022F04BD1|nr:adenosine deaminase [Homoserinibacter sp. YIM 151385]WBU36814.1 adenosine deaminase [Homoserinibacter sp. YIM 151385]
MTTPADDVATVVDGIPLAGLPKISLHDHLDGGLRPSTIVELAERQGVELPAADPAALTEWFAQQTAAGKSLVEYLETFRVTLSVMQTRDGLVRTAHDFALDLAADGIIYGEVRWAPEQHQQGGLSLDEAVEAVQEGLDAGAAAARAAGHDLRTGQLLIAMRQADRGLEIAELAIRHRHDGVVGYDIAGPEAGYPAGRLADAFAALDRAFLPRTVHAGEADGIESIRGALLDGRANRLGHGVRLAEDIRIVDADERTTTVELGEIAQWVKDREIVLETSPTSNLQTGAFAQWGDDIRQHPVDLLHQLGYRVTVNTDNRLMSRTTLTRELGLLADAFGYGLDDLHALQVNAAIGAFLPLEDREELIARLDDGWGVAR